MLLLSWKLESLVPAGFLCLPRTSSAAIASFLNSRYQETWNHCLGNTLYAIKPYLSYWSSSSRRFRREEVVLCRLRTGHTYATHGYLLCNDSKTPVPQVRFQLNSQTCCFGLSPARRRKKGILWPPIIAAEPHRSAW